ncbi:Cj0069 family protein [Methylobacterium sp. PvR107]|uniref:Cj0069 family protein n=1 Tax=Methylobacterium sp. PvR107 TaxID=2806597 RepID=UPI001AE70169|nr:Cj0069 family protein [Methylobacterium sp. PvR107]
MPIPGPAHFKVAVVWRGDAKARAEARPETSRFAAVFAALGRHGLAAEPAVWVGGRADVLRAELMGMDAVLVWVNPVTKDTGEDRGALDALLREVAAAGVLVSAHPDVIDRVGTKEVLYQTREMGWGTDTHLYASCAALAAAFPRRLAEGPRVLKRSRGNGGIGVWKVERAASAEEVLVQEASDRRRRTVLLDAFLAERASDFAAGLTLVDQPFQMRHLEGMVRCYVSGTRAAGFGTQLVTALAPPEHGRAPPRLYSGPEDERFQRLRCLLERDWIPEMTNLLGLKPDDLPVIWDADFLLGPKDAGGEDTYVLCEINVSSVFPIPDEAPDVLAATTLRRLADARR